MKIGGKDYKRSELERRIGNTSQLGGLLPFEYSAGAARGTRAIEFDCGSGFRFTTVPDRGLDIYACTYKGINLVYRTPNGVVHPAFYSARGDEWLRTFYGGLLTTCGLTYFGAAGDDDEEELGLHGRYSTIPAARVNDTSHWNGDDYVLEVSGITEESVFFGSKLKLSRSISAKLGNRHVCIRDRVQNFGYRSSPLTILYHINAGFPLLDDTAELVIASVDVAPEDEQSRQGMAQRMKVSEPVPDFKEHNFLYTVARDSEGSSRAALVNRDLARGLGLYVLFTGTTLPYLNVWKMMACGEYVVALEPCNTRVANRAILRQTKELPFLKPGERHEFELQIGVLDGDREIDDFCAKAHGLQV